MVHWGGIVERTLCSHWTPRRTCRCVARADVFGGGARITTGIVTTDSIWGDSKKIGTDGVVELRNHSVIALVIVGAVGRVGRCRRLVAVIFVRVVGIMLILVVRGPSHYCITIEFNIKSRSDRFFKCLFSVSRHLNRSTGNRPRRK